ncbi:hypothetical protein BJ138DRAFT_1094777 [Hygrophoropsis aurantiaca]|uniref:Uncharacterized protein n=1 Tax=Hygrophoropsis aurantiaca TaxID=72124 RepID=A0ACB7ZXH0_9AGAM|nr:hypothetical protein BJ138DRAFT_1094777 [Hygrophoropsis aurantiaca]
MAPNPPLHSTYDEHMSRMFPDHQPTSPELLKRMLYALGATDDTLHEHLAAQNKYWDEMLGEGGKARKIAVCLIFNCHVPNSMVAIRIWSGNMENCGLYCLDFVNVDTHTPLNAPDGYDIWHVYHPGTNVARRWWKLVTLNIAFGVPSKAGEEHYMVPEGSRLQLLRPDETPFYFEIPKRPTMGQDGNILEFAQPVPVLIEPLAGG